MNVFLCRKQRFLNVHNISHFRNEQGNKSIGSRLIIIHSASSSPSDLITTVPLKDANSLLKDDLVGNFDSVEIHHILRTNTIDRTIITCNVT